MKKLFQFRTALRFFIFKLYLYSFRKSIIDKANRKVQKKIIFRSKYGFNINLDLAQDVDRYFYMGMFEVETIWFFKKLLRPDLILFDIGANIGIFSLIAAKKLNNNGKIYAFEPSDRVYNQFEENIKLNSFNNIFLYKVGMSDKAGSLEFHVCADDAYNSLGSVPLREILYTTEIQVSSIDEFCKENDITRIDVLKIDTEGAESSVIEGGKNMLKGDNAPIIFSEYNRHVQSIGNLMKIESLLREYGYELYELWFGLFRKFTSESRTNDIIALKEYHVKRYINN